MKKLRILLADDHKIVREGLRMLINSQPDMQVVGEAANGREVLVKARELKPDVVVMDLSMPELNGLQATERLKTERPEMKVVALTAHEDESYLRQLCKVAPPVTCSNVRRAMNWSRPSARWRKAGSTTRPAWPARRWRSR